MSKASKNMPSSVPEHRATFIERRRSEVNLSGPGSNWTIHFAENRDLSDAMTFRRGGDDAQFPGTSRHTLSIFGLDGSIKVRDSRSVTVRRRNEEGQMANSVHAVWASVEIPPQDFEVLRHEEMGEDWITLIKLRPGRTFTVRNGPMSPSTARSSLPIYHDMLRLWSRRSELRSMRFLAIMVRDYQNYVPWMIILQRETLGPTVKPAAAYSGLPSSAASTNPPATIPSAAETKDHEDEPLIDLWSEERSSGPSNSRIGEAQMPPPVELLSNKPAEDEEPRHDPFRGIWEHAVNLKNIGNE